MKVSGVYSFGGVKTRLKQVGKELLFFRYAYDGDKIGEVVARKSVFERPFYDIKEKLRFNKVIYKQNYQYNDLKPTQTFIRILVDEENKPAGRWIEIKDAIAGHLSVVKDNTGKIVRLIDRSMATDKIYSQRVKSAPVVAKKYVNDVRKFLGLEEIN